MVEIDTLDAETILQKAVYDDLFQIEDDFERTVRKAKLFEKAKELKVISLVRDLVGKRESDLSRKRREERNKKSLTTIDNITNFYPDSKGVEYTNMYCGAWIAAEDGIYTADPQQATRQMACYHPILPVRRLENMQTGEEQITIAFKRNNQWKELTVPKTMTATARSITNLASSGVAVTSENARLLVKYLADVENWNSDIVELQRSTSKLGWHGNEFVPYDKAIVFDGAAKMLQIYKSITEAGDFETWLSCMRKLRSSGNFVARIALAASFSSVLLKPLGALPFIVDFYGESGGGKTVTLMLAASVWADPDNSGYIANLKASSVNLEVRSDMLNHLPHLLDDTSHADKRIMENYESIIYDLCAGIGKGRSNKELGVQRQLSWQNVIISNGEKPLSSYVSQGGAINRLIEIECNHDIFSNPKEILSVIKRNYGLAGKKFVEHMKEIPEKEIRETCADFERQLTTDQSMQKQVAAMAALLTADKIATECIFQDGKSLRPEDVSHILSERNDVSDNVRCYYFILDALNEYRQHFDIDANVDQWGEIDSSLNTVYFYPHAFEKLLEREGYSRKAFTAWARKKRLIICSGSRDTYVKKVAGVPKRYIAVKICEDFESEDAIKSEDGWERVEDMTLFDD